MDSETDCADKTDSTEDSSSALLSRLPMSSAGCSRNKHRWAFRFPVPQLPHL